MSRFFVLAVLSALWGAAAGWLFRRLSRRERLTRAMNRIVAHALEMPLFIDEPAVVLRATRGLLVANISLLGAILLPASILALSFALLYSPLNAIFGFGPLRVNEPAVVTAKARWTDGLELRASQSIAIETPPVRAMRKGEVSWRVRPVTAGPQVLRVANGAREFRAGSARVTRTGDAGIPWIEVPWPAAAYLHFPWEAWFVIISCGSAILFSLAKPNRRSTAFMLALMASAGARAQTPVILISVDTLRADHLSCYGYRRVRTPHIDSLARGGTLFRRIDAQIPLTLPSHTSLLTSTYPFDNYVEENGSLVPPGTLTLASVLRSQGYKTAAFIGSIALDRRYGLDQGFDVYDSPFVSSAAPQNPYSMRVTRDAPLVFRAARQWIDANRDRPFFAFIHLYDLHLPYRLRGYSPVEPSLAGYDAELQYVDGATGRFLEFLTRSGLWSRAMIVLLADHGESLGEHEQSGHGYFVYESTLHVPLVIHWAAARSRHPEQVDQPGGLIDVAPTILESLGIKAPREFKGRSLFAGSRPVLSESVYARDAFGWAPLRSIRISDKKYIEAPRAEFYDLKQDRRELRNELSAASLQAAAMKQKLDEAILKKGPTQARASSGDRALRSLGYVAGPARPPNAHPDIDPKDRIREYEAYTRAVGLMYVGRAREAVPLLRAVLAGDPRNYAIRVDLGHALLDIGRPAEAMREWESILARDPTYTPASEAEGFYWMEKLDFAEAERAFEKTLRVAPRDYEANFAMTIVEEKLGKKAEAEKHHRVVCGISPSTEGCGQAKTP